MIYSVGIREVHVNTVEVEAANEEEAKCIAEEKIQAGATSSLNIEWSHNLDKDLWSVEPVE